jgi:ABC-type multidrug transport system fused ATPase/permease subunit
MFWPERARLTAVVALCALSVGCAVSGPALLGSATNIVFSGVVSKLVPADATRVQAIATLRAHGQGQLAGIFAAMDIAPHAGIALTRLGGVLVLAAVAYALSSVLGWAQASLLAGITQRTAYRLRQEVEDKLARVPLRYFDRHPHGDILSRVANDVDNIDTAFQEVFGVLPSLAFTILGAIAFMFWLSPLLAAFSLVAVPVILVAGGLLAGRAKPRFAAQWEHTGNLTALAEESFTGYALVQAFGRQAQMDEEFGRENQRLTHASFRAQYLSGVIRPITLFVGNLNYVIVAVIGGYWVATGAISLGAVQAFIQYSRQLTSSITQFAAQLNLLQSGLASAERVFEFLDTTEEAALRGRSGGTADEHVATSVRFQDVCFGYDPGTPLIENFTLEAAPGQMVAIVGPTGAGKTTVVNLLVRFYEANSGQILLDGVDYRDLSRDEVRRSFGMVLQDTWLFAGTIRDNIAYGRHGASDDEIEAAARAAHVDEFVATLPRGYATVLDADASAVSAGQKQLLTIARAFLADPGILILDEATSSVDTRTEALIQSAMARLRSGRTSFVIAHRLSTVRDADTIVVMDGGRVVEQGTHDALIDRRGAYHGLYHSQFAKTENSRALSKKRDEWCEFNRRICAVERVAENHETTRYCPSSARRLVFCRLLETNIRCRNSFHSRPFVRRYDGR